MCEPGPSSPSAAGENTGNDSVAESTNVDEEKTDTVRSMDGNCSVVVEVSK